jgi:D-alanyl-D-alanine carboxypeptidase/D-alanyl-D-alanine-endopeptidase (penicillin-binding protein 4)
VRSAAGRLRTVARDAHLELSASIWIEGIGEIVGIEPDHALLPASNQKIVTAIGVLALLDPDTVMHTTVATTTSPTSGRLAGDLVLVAGGDPTLTRHGPHSLNTLAARVRASGISQVRGDLVVDDSRHARARSAPGWQSWHIPQYAGPLSAFIVDDNRYRSDPDYIANPARANGEEFARALREHGVAIAGSVRLSRARNARHEIAVLTSPTMSHLVAEMLTRSDNEIAEALTREVGQRARHRGTTAAGTRAFDDVLAQLCGTVQGSNGDGSGLSRANHRSARELRMLLQAAGSQAWSRRFVAGLPVAARSGTLSGRFHGTAAAANLRAKTGTIIGGRALSGYVTSAGGRSVVFSIIVNGEASGSATAAMDALIAAVADDDS